MRLPNMCLSGHDLYDGLEQIDWSRRSRRSSWMAWSSRLRRLRDKRRGMAAGCPSEERLCHCFSVISIADDCCREGIGMPDVRRRGV